MVERIVWQINPGDFHGDTQGMSATEVGAYMLLLMTYWRIGSLPDDDASLRRIARTDFRQWKRMKPRLQRLFHDGWKHKRVEADLAKLAKYREQQQANACGKNGTQSTNSVHNGTPGSAPRSSDRSGHKPLKSFNPTPATAPHSLLPLRKTDNSFFGTGSNPDPGPPVDRSASADQNPKPNKFQNAWMDALAQQMEPHDYAEAIGFLLADNELRNRITSAEIRERGSGVMAAVIALTRRSS
jgi:uncharacterized protein YdaU (DUF1376 family)